MYVPFIFVYFLDVIDCRSVQVSVFTLYATWCIEYIELLACCVTFSPYSFGHYIRHSDIYAAWSIKNVLFSLHVHLIQCSIAKKQSDRMHTVPLGVTHYTHGLFSFKVTYAQSVGAIYSLLPPTKELRH